MPSNNFPIGVGRNPLVFSVYNQRFNDGQRPAPPPASAFRITDASDIRITDDGDNRVTDD